MTAPPVLPYEPDHAAPPGDLIQEYLDELDISLRELARRCGRSGKLMAEIAAGKAPIEPETALQLERVLGASASIWSNMEAAYQLHLARESEQETLDALYDWAKAFPMKELAERGFIAQAGTRAQQVQELLRYFGAGSVKACDERIAELLQVAFRTSTAFENHEPALAAWLRIGERKALSTETAEYDRDTFLRQLRDIRALTEVPINKACLQIAEKCAAAGVVFVLEKPFAKIRASGVSRWLSPRKALIQQSLRHKANDHFWFTFFHECAHILLHSRKTVFIDMQKGPGNAEPKQEAEANAWAANFLIPVDAMRNFVLNFSGAEKEVRAFAKDIGIAPGIVVGQLQHNRVVGYNVLNKLKDYYEWVDEN